uniref:hypothetical protein n=1 Tax=Nocardioides ferulae TaxID=2340821 RepID=UPI00198003ED
AEDAVVRRRAVLVEDLELCLAWADLHGVLPPDPVEWKGRRPDGAPRLVRPGGEGSPELVDVAVFELSIARGVHVHSTRTVLA